MNIPDYAAIGKACKKLGIPRDTTAELANLVSEERHGRNTLYRNKPAGHWAVESWDKTYVPETVIPFVSAKELESAE